MPFSSNKSQIGHTLGAAAAIEGALSIEAMQQGVLLPTINHIPDPAFDDVDVVPNETRRWPMKFSSQTPSGSAAPTAALFSGGYEMRPKPFVPQTL
jgi:3-oxoacyl-(acyl-carrier-protein) synthase